MKQVFKKKVLTLVRNLVHCCRKLVICIIVAHLSCDFIAIVAAWEMIVQILFMWLIQGIQELFCH